ncbi:phosphopentomutase [Kiloniella laminariae]|uniref:Phosphopentomutase n=1 Tax=Kiloniella laminariae TaxID=454162 RepID=A0ABT4LP51_9PROT|nr:phosphopentomutase [Kiloniella laminariae]MCZ4282675.1 phosphopentomutase [Kiloniella laminariae]
MARAFILLLDSFGIGGAPDARNFGDEGADTLGHIAKECAAGRADKAGVRSGPLALPIMESLGLGLAAQTSTGLLPEGFSSTISPPNSLYGCASETSNGKDTPSGHWEIAGVPVTFDWGYFPNKRPCFDQDLITDIITRAKLPGILGNCHASGTEIIEEFGAEHMVSGKPILYTSADSVLQVAAHEESFGLDRLMELCLTIRDLVDDLNIGRVIARPFIGNDSKPFVRTGNRRDFSVLPPAPTLLNHVRDAGREMIAIGKVGDIYAHQGPTQVIKASGHDQLFEKTMIQVRSAPEGSLTFTNFVDFDSLYGHRRDVIGYAAALEDFDHKLAVLMPELKSGDLVVLTADHGCDPTWAGSDHTRENIPVLAFGPGLPTGNIGRRSTFADIGQSVASFLGVPPLTAGQSFI